MTPRFSTLASRLAAGICCLLVVGGCTPLQHHNLTTSSTALPARVELTDTPFYAQRVHHCGPAALAMVLNATGVDTSPDELVPLVYTPGREGSFAGELRAAVRRHERLVYPLNPGFDDLLRQLAAGHPVLVMQNLGLSWYPRWHYAVAVGYDLEQRQMILRSGRQRRRVAPFSTFERTWRRADYWALLALSPGELPAEPAPLRYLGAVADLEALGFYQPANTGYLAAVQQWPDNLTARMGVANTYYRLHRPAEAEHAYQQALSLDPGYAPAYNNLAQLYHDRGELKAAEQAARKAVELGGLHSPTYRQTLNEILEARAGVGSGDP